MKKLHVLMLLLTASVLLAGCQDSSDSPGFEESMLPKTSSDSGESVISAADDAEITLNLNGCTITNSSTSPICIMTAGEVDISARKDTVNQIYDLRNSTNSTDDLMGNAAGIRGM